MIAEDCTQEESTDTDIPNEDARTAQTCEVCGKTDEKVQTNTWLDSDREPIDAHVGCLPPMTADWDAWYAEHVEDEN